MTWVRLDDSFADHPKIIAAGPIAALIQVRALCYACRHLTDGFLAINIIPSLLTGFEHVGLEHASACDGLVGFGADVNEYDWPKIMVEHHLWESVAGGYQIHDFLDYQPSKKEVNEARKSKQAAGKLGAKSRWNNNNQAISQPLAPAIAHESGLRKRLPSEGKCPPSPSPKEDKSSTRDNSTSEPKVTTDSEVIRYLPEVEHERKKQAALALLKRAGLQPPPEVA